MASNKVFEKDLFITVFSDASFCPRTKAAGYGGWVKGGYPPQVLRVGGVITNCRNPEEAEISAIVQTLTHAEKTSDPEFSLDWEGKILVIQTDCQGAIKKLKPEMKKVLKHLRLKFIKWKWVKAHSGYGDPRSAVNEYCDKQAKFYMLQERKRRQREEQCQEN